MTTTATTSRQGRRWRVAAAIVLAAAGFAAAVLLAGTWLSARRAPRPPSVVTQVDQLGDRAVLVRVDNSGASAAADAARASMLRLTLVVLGLALVPVAGGAWLLAGRGTRRGDESPAAENAGDAGGPAPVASAEEAAALAARLERERLRHLQDVVHELRTPLAVAATNLDLAATTPDLDPDVGVHVAAARRGVERLARTVDDLAVHGRLAVADEAGVLDLVAEARALADEQAGPAQLRGLSVRVEGPERVSVAADKAAVLTAVGNLLANAVRLAPAGSVVRLGCGVWEDWAWIAVRDEGPGLPVEDHERAFHRYWRGRYDVDRETGEGEARGIGLTIARQVTEAQGGHLTVRSQVGVGSTFVVWLPRSAEARTERVVADDGVHHRVDPMPAPVALAAAP
jgi:signal transduction histidine kinase